MTSLGGRIQIFCDGMALVAPAPSRVAFLSQPGAAPPYQANHTSTRARGGCDTRFSQSHIHMIPIIRAIRSKAFSYFLPFSAGKLSALKVSLLL